MCSSDLISGRPDNFAGEPEPGQHTVRVVIGSPADEGDYTRNRRGAKCFRAQVDRGLPGRVDIVAGDQQIYLAATGRQGAEILDDDAELNFAIHVAREPEEHRHALR